VNNSRLSLYMQSIRGPVLLMTLGALCALHQADIASFRMTWPVLFIVVGMLVLFERLLAPPVVSAPFQTTGGGATVPPNFPQPTGWSVPQNPYAAQNPYAPRNPVPPQNRPPVTPEFRPPAGPQQGEPR
jgi:hypothetical protein